ncbi:STAS domain-containing protein [Dactylosporangium cerinum]|uniref:STAS domain-containing protein n=1 Tax=Dactylosporangium cerinum TaxID=1434730 RepID=A0ABV9W823_9ACTN
MTVEPVLACDLERGFPVSVVRANGRLSIASAPMLRRAVLKALADQPELILLDVSGLRAEDDLALTALPMLARQSAADGIAMIVTGPPTALRRQLEAMAVTRWVTVAESRASALDLHAHAPGPLRAALQLPAHPSATTAARRLVDDACRRWRITYLADIAGLVVTELVANSVLHAGTPMRLLLSLREHHLHVSVRDGSSRLPRPMTADEDLESGRGLLIIEGLAAAWGSVAVAGGKVVWVTLQRARQPSDPR